KAQARQSWPSSGSGHTGYTGNGYSGDTSTPSGGSPGSSSSGGSAWTDPNAGAADGFDWDYVGPSVCEPGKFCPLA
ncbi:colicin transporter, partial [Bifidobacterium bifidum]|nr:colicin transporter [Bifidobacterium bifidum]MDB1220507.1 colicin transporter [Bifidobacterium bifidum]MDB1223982.1 colicin transporter [Bifidobacterium bifidum]MDB1225720.1 colicin transporter [Bifidobacterium bifidum]MDB1227471.1 colicin transporter [Bifidobacterium bifidum]